MGGVLKSAPENRKVFEMLATQVLSCPNCAANLSRNDSFCEFCGSEVLIRRISSFRGFSAEKLRKYQSSYQKQAGLPGARLGLGLCYLKCGNYPLAKIQFEKAVEESPESPEAYYYCSLALIGGRRIMTISMKEARQIVANLNTALMLNTDFLCARLLLALICLDYYDANALRAPEDGNEILEELSDLEFDDEEIKILNSAASTDSRTYFN